MSCLLSTKRKVQGFVVPGLAFQCARPSSSFMEALGHPAVMVAPLQLIREAAFPCLISVRVERQICPRNTVVATVVPGHKANATNWHQELGQTGHDMQKYSI